MAETRYGNKDCKDKVWNLAKTIHGKDPNMYRKDPVGNQSWERLLVYENLIFSEHFYINTLKILFIYILLYFLNPFIFATNIFIICNTSSTNSSCGSLSFCPDIIVIFPFEYFFIISSISSYPNLHNLSL